MKQRFWLLVCLGVIGTPIAVATVHFLADAMGYGTFDPVARQVSAWPLAAMAFGLTATSVMYPFANHFIQDGRPGEISPYFLFLWIAFFAFAPSSRTLGFSGGTLGVAVWVAVTIIQMSVAWGMWQAIQHESKARAERGGRRASD